MCVYFHFRVNGFPLSESWSVCFEKEKKRRKSNTRNCTYFVLRSQRERFFSSLFLRKKTQIIIKAEINAASSAHQKSKCGSSTTILCIDYAIQNELTFHFGWREGEWERERAKREITGTKRVQKCFFSSASHRSALCVSIMCKTFALVVRIFVQINWSQWEICARTIEIFQRIPCTATAVTLQFSQLINLWK